MKAKLTEVEDAQNKKNKAAMQTLEAKNLALEEQLRIAEELVIDLDEVIDWSIESWWNLSGGEK